MQPYDNMSKTELYKKYGTWIKNNLGADELKLLKEDATGPGGLQILRDYLSDIDPEPRGGNFAGGLITKKKYVNKVKIVDHLKKKK